MIAIVLPTYNERENLPIIIPKIFKAASKIKHHETHIIIADDKSPDNTLGKAEELKKKYKNIHLLPGEKYGLGAAYIRGFDYAVSRLGADILVEMDADLSHDPNLLPRMVGEIDSGYDVVIGSRYIKGGATPDWDPARKTMSRLGNLYSRLIVKGMFNLKDITSGYRAIKAEAYNGLEKDSISRKGYAFQLSLLHALAKSGARIKEIPIIFKDRIYGETKLRGSDVSEFFISALRLRIIESRRFFIFLVVGAICSVFNLLSLYLLGAVFGLDKRLLSPSISLELTIIMSFFLNNRFTFRERRSQSIATRFFKFHLAALSAFALNLIIYNIILHYFGLDRLCGSYDFLCAQAMTIGIVVFWNYFINSKWTWKR